MGSALSALITNVGNVLLDKYILSQLRMKVENYIPLAFVFIFLVTAVALPWTGSVNMTLATNQQYLFYFILMVLLAIIWNIFYYQGLQREKIVEFEMILLLTPLATVLLTTLFFPEEFNPSVFVAAIIGSVTLFLSHLRKYHLEFNKHAIHLLLAVILIAMETMVQKELLAIYSPTLLYALRVGFLAFFFAIYYRPKVAEVSDQQFRLVFASAVLGAASMITRFYAFQEIGVIFTTLVLLLVPVMTSWLDTRINRTRIKKRTVLAFAIILMCVIYAIVNQ